MQCSTIALKGLRAGLTFQTQRGSLEKISRCWKSDLGFANRRLLHSCSTSHLVAMFLIYQPKATTLRKRIWQVG